LVLIPIFGIFCGIVFIVSVAGVFVAVAHMRSRERIKLHDTLRVLAEKDGPSQHELIAALNNMAEPTPDRDLRRGITSLAIAGGLAGLGIFIGMGDGDIVWPLVGIAFFPLALGIGLLVLWRIGSQRTGA
jgi:hypothetical protein